MEMLIVGGIALVFVIGFFGGIVGSWISKTSSANAEVPKVLGSVKASLERLQSEQLKLAERISKFENQSPAQSKPVTPDAPTIAPALPVQAPPARPQSAAAEEGIAAPPAAKTPSSAQRAIKRPIANQTPAEPNWFMRWLLGGNTVVRVGIVILFFGVAFLFKYTYERVQIPPELRLTGVALLAIGLLGLGWRLRMKRPGYALALQGGGIGVLYLTVFAALRLYQVLLPTLAMALLVIIATASAILAVVQNSRALAILGTSGGFLAPILASTGSGSHVMLFSYYALLNLGVVSIAYWRAWRELNLLGFAFTFVISAIWGARFYQPPLFATTELFLILFFLIYVAVPIFYARRQAFELRAYVDASLVFGTPLIAFGLQSQLISDIEYGLAFSALTLGIFYLGLVWFLQRREPALRMLVESFLALGVVFSTLAIPLAFEGRWTAAAWSLEAAAIIWIGIRQQRIGARLFAMLLQVGGGLMFLADMPHGGPLAILNVTFMGCSFVAFAGLFSAWYLDKNANRIHASERYISVALLVWGWLWWLGGGLSQVEEYILPQYQFAITLLFVSASYAVLAWWARRSDWNRGGNAALTFGILLAFACLQFVDSHVQPFARLGFLAWPIALAVHLWVLRLHEARAPGPATWLHALGVWLLALLGTRELAWWINESVGGARAWGYIALVIVPGALLIALTRLPQRWPFVIHARSYILGGGVPLAITLLAWTAIANWMSDGSADPLPYVPLLNPLDIALVAALLITTYWLNFTCIRSLITPGDEERNVLFTVFGALAFAILNGILLRSLHHFGGVEYNLDAMLMSRLAQTAVSIFWTVLALIVMLLGTRAQIRKLWIAGAALMAVVVGKLFLVDLSGAGGIERVVSFMGVGLLMLVIGFLAPVPPKSVEIQNEA